LLSTKPNSQANPSWVAIINPASANGRTGKRWKKNQALLKKILPSFEAWLTRSTGHAWELAQRAFNLGFTTIAVHGGDGTINEVVNGLLDRTANGLRLALLPSGTGADLVRTLGISHSLARAAQQALNGSVRSIDIGKASFTDLENRPAERFFVNVTDVGFGGELVRYVNSRSKRLGGRLSFFKGVLVTLFRYRNKRVRLTLDEGETFETPVSSIVVANGQYFGGGMWVAPEARPDDGYFDVIVIGDVSKTDVLTNIGRLYRGTLAAHPKVKTFRARTLELSSEEEVLIDLDGELVGRLPARFEVLPQKLSVIC
jgi:YegS/Rv2252/BmrU family lipid kinase